MKKQNRKNISQTNAPKKTKASQVKAHLLKKKHITSWEAITLYQATRLAAIIFNLKDEGYQIVTSPISTKDVNGNSVTYAKYKLVGLPQKK